MLQQSFLEMEWDVEISRCGDDDNNITVGGREQDDDTDSTVGGREQGDDTDSTVGGKGAG